MIILKKELSGITLQYLRGCKGRLTEVSELCQINRSMFTPEHLAKMQVRTFVHIIYALAVVMSKEEYMSMMDEFRDTIGLHALEHHYLLFDE